jgi:peptidoglycan-N-acetylglucosamine deacetylase
VKVFIDLGPYNGDSLEAALKKYKHYDHFYAFEPLSKNFEILKKRFSDYNNISLIHAAADIRSGQSELYLGREFGDEGGSLCKDKKTNFKDRIEVVMTIDFAKFIKDQFDRNDEIILKIDIEGKEYDLLNKMIKDGSMEYIDEIFCEWHWDRLNISEDEHCNVLESVNKLGFCLTGINKYDGFLNIIEKTNAPGKYKYYLERRFLLIRIFFEQRYQKIYYLLKQIKRFSQNKGIKQFLWPLTRYLGTITHVNTTEPVAALTFDDGPDPVYTPKLLEILDKYKSRGTFFMVGEAAQRQPELVKEIAQAGHAIGIHSWDHSSFTSISGRQRRQQLRACMRVIGCYGERLFRPPWGKQNVASRLDALLLGLKVITWNVVVEDWLDLEPVDMADRLIRKIRPGSIIVLHDAIYRSMSDVPQNDRSAMLEALEITLRQVGNQFSFITVPELLRHGRPAMQAWF